MRQGLVTVMISLCLSLFVQDSAGIVVSSVDDDTNIKINILIEQDQEQEKSESAFHVYIVM